MLLTPAFAVKARWFSIETPHPRVGRFVCLKAFQLLRRGRMVMSRTWASTLAICMPFSLLV